MDQSTKAAGTGSETGSVQSGSSRSACGKSAEKSTVVAVGSKKDKPKEETTVVKKKSGTSTSKKSAKSKNVVNPDSDIFQKLGKSSKGDLEFMNL